MKKHSRKMTRFLVVLLFFCVTALEGAAPKKKVSKSDGKIVGGQDTNINQVPYQASLQYRNRHICGGSIIDSRHIVTAAHCVDRLNSRDMSVRVGSSLHASGGEVHRVRKATAHPNYNRSTTNNDIAVIELDSPIKASSGARIMPWKNKYRGKHFDNDIAVLELATPVTFGEKVKAIGLASTEPNAGDTAKVSGWGATREGGGASRSLQSVEVPAITRESCQRQYMRYNTVTDRMWCAGYPEGGKDACQGDSGGPAVVNGRLAGVVSWGAGCARRNSPGVYTNVAKYTTWIAQNSNSRRRKP